MTKKYTSRKINKPVDFNDQQDDSFYDISFDLPIDEETSRHSSPGTESDLNGSTHQEKSSKWDGFYDEFREKQDMSFEKAKQEQVEFNEKFRQQADGVSSKETPLAPIAEDFIQKDAAKSSMMLDRSIRKVRSLFADFENYEAPKSNPYKSEVQETLKHRESNFLKKEELQALQTNRNSEPSIDFEEDQNELETSPKWFERFRQNSTNQKRHSTSPSPSENLNEDMPESNHTLELTDASSEDEIIESATFEPNDDSKSIDTEMKEMAHPMSLNREDLNEVLSDDIGASFSEVKHSEKALSWYQRLNPFKDPTGPFVTQEGNTLDPENSLQEKAESLEIDDDIELPGRVKKSIVNEFVLDKDYFEVQAEAVPDTKATPIKDSHEEKIVSPRLEQEATQSDWASASRNLNLSRRRYASDLPSPEEIRKERERRRRLRVQELEQMTTSEEVEQSYKKSYTEWLKDFNKKTAEKDATHIEKDNSLTIEPIIVTPNLAGEYTDSKILNQSPIQLDNLHENKHSGDEKLLQSEIDCQEKKVSVDSDNSGANLSSSHQSVEPFTFSTADELLTTENEFSKQPMGDSRLSEDQELVDDIPNSVPLLTDEQTIDEEPKLLIDEAFLVPDLYQSDGKSPLERLDQTHPIVDVTLAMKTNSLDSESDVPESLSTSENQLMNSNENASSESQTPSDTLTNGTKLTNNKLINTADEPSSFATNLPVLSTSTQIADVSESQLLDLTQVSLAAAETESTHFTVIHEPINAVEIDEQLTAELEANLLSESIPIYKRKDKKTKKEIYSLATFSTKEKVFFGLNITFNVIKRIGLYIILIGILGGAMAAGTGFGYFANLVSKTPPPTQEEMSTAINRLEQQSTLYYASGDPIANIRADIVRTITSRDEVSPFIIDGLIATEDENFYNHPGVMPKAILRAVIESIFTDDGSGGSTLTQQLVKQQLLSPDVTFFRKANEILLALRLENYFTKDQILMAYLNVSPFGRNNNGDNVAGIMKASQGIFGVEPSDVNLNQAAFLVGLPQDPYNFTPYDQLGMLVDDFQSGIDRMHEVLYRMYREEKITKEAYDAALAYDITQDFLPQETRDEQRQSYLYQAMMNGAIEQLMLMNIKEDGYDWKIIYDDVDWYNEYYFAAEEQLRTGGYKVYTTIDKEIYDHLQVSATTYDDQLGATYDGIYTDPETGAETYYIENVQTGIVVTDNKTGKVLGFVAGKDFENNQIDHAFNMRRSPGSTIKPLAVYGPAIEENLINPSTIIPDTEFVQTDSEGNEYRPTNYGGVVSGTFYSARTALMKSDNLPTVRIYEQLLNRKVPIIDYLEKMGFNTVDSYTETDTSYLSFALGGVSTGPTVFEQTRGFSTFANNGQYIDGYYIERIEDTFGNVVFQQNEPAVQVFSEDSNYLMVDMLRDTMDGGSGQTAGGVKNFGGDWIAKSGISEDSKDIWFIGSTPAITIGSWIGYDNQYAQHVFDLNDGFDREAVRSQTYWGNIVNDLYAFRPDIFGIDQTFTQPDSVQTQTVLQTTGTLSGNVQINNRAYQVTSPTYDDLFKKSHPAQALSFNFMFNATDADHQTFWTQYAQTVEQQRQQQQQQPASSSSSSSESEESSADETSETPPAESTPEGTAPVETPPAE